MIVANLDSELKPIIVCFVVCVELTNLSTFLLLKLISGEPLKSISIIIIITIYDFQKLRN